MPLLVAAALLVAPGSAADPDGLRPAAHPGGLARHLETGVLADGPDPRRAEIRDAVTAFYRDRGHRAAWVRGGRLLPVGEAALAALATSREHGLDPALYDIAGLAAAAARLRAGDATAAWELEADLAAALALYGSHLVRGRIGPEDLEKHWRTTPRRLTVESFLANAATGDLAAAVARLTPPHAGYRALVDLHRRYRRLAADGGWPAVPEGPVLRPGDRAEKALLGALAGRLAADGDLATTYVPTATYDADLAAAVRRFQTRHGLEADGVVGPATHAALAVPVAERLRQIALNLERWRWLPGELGRRHVVVNLPAYHLAAYQDGERVLAMKAAIGRPGWSTPVFTADLTTVVFNPFWGVPESVGGTDVLAEAQRDPAFLVEHGFEVYDGERLVDPRAVSWERYDRASLPYRFRQRPGPTNALGTVKFLFPPSDFNIYLHDTPEKEGFAETRRALSHGCVRVEDPAALADYVFAHRADWAGAAALLADGDTRHLRVDERVTVYFLYWTAFADDAGRAHFRDDVYGHDRAAEDALRRRGYRLEEPAT